LTARSLGALFVKQIRPGWLRARFFCRIGGELLIGAAAQLCKCPIFAYELGAVWRAGLANLYSPDKIAGALASLASEDG
jgi:hypothetical protein